MWTNVCISVCHLKEIIHISAEHSLFILHSNAIIMTGIQAGIQKILSIMRNISVLNILWEIEKRRSDIGNERGRMSWNKNNINHIDILF